MQSKSLELKSHHLMGNFKIKLYGQVQAFSSSTRKKILQNIPPTWCEYHLYRDHNELNHC